MKYQDIKNGRFYWEDCFDAMKEIPDGVIDMILCDLPYGTTQNKWDSVLPLDKLWAEYWRVCKSNAAIVLTAAQPFTSFLIVQQIDNYKYSWVWDKVNRPTGHLNSKIQPMRQTEDIVIFYKQQPIYNPQMVQGEPYRATGSKKSDNYGSQVTTTTVCDDGMRYPRNLLAIKADERGKHGRVHPTQKPVALFEYLIKTYTNEDELVLDNTAGSGTTAIAAINTDRRWICIEKDETYANKAIERINAHTKP